LINMFVLYLHRVAATPAAFTVSPADASNFAASACAPFVYSAGVFSTIFVSIVKMW